MDISRSHSKMIQRDSGIKSEKEEKKMSYRDLIRQQIDKFLKQNSQWCYFIIKIVKTKKFEFYQWSQKGINK